MRPLAFKLRPSRGWNHLADRTHQSPSPVPTCPIGITMPRASRLQSRQSPAEEETSRSQSRRQPSRHAKAAKPSLKEPDTDEFDSEDSETQGPQTRPTSSRRPADKPKDEQQRSRPMAEADLKGGRFLSLALLPGPPLLLLPGSPCPSPAA